MTEAIIGLVKRRQIKLHSTDGSRCCELAYADNAEAIIDGYSEKRGNYNKCLNCGYRGKKSCERIACMSYERKDGKSIIMEKI